MTPANPPGKADIIGSNILKTCIFLMMGVILLVIVRMTVTSATMTMIMLTTMTTVSTASNFSRHECEMQDNVSAQNKTNKVL